MYRLTYDFSIGNFHCFEVRGADNLLCSEVCKNQDGNGCDGCPIKKAIDRLAAYEDIFYGKDGTERISINRLRALAEADRDGRIKIINVPPKGERCGNCVNFLREKSTAHGTCKTQHRNRYGNKLNLRCVSQSTKACQRLPPPKQRPR